MTVHTVIAAEVSDIDRRIAEASKWVEPALPVIKAWFALDLIDADLRAAGYETRTGLRWNDPVTYGERVADEARSYLRDPMKYLHEVVEGIRSDFISDAMPKQPIGEATQAQWDAYDAEYERCDDEIERSVPSVDQAIKQVGDAL